MDDLQKLISGYVLDSNNKKDLKDSQIVLLVGPTGSGKNTILNELLKTNKFEEVISHTTRMPRKNRGILERDGREYHFISNDQAIDMLKNHDFIEVAYTHGCLYGTSISEVKKATNKNKIAVADVDVKGVRSFRYLSNSITAIYLLPPNFDILIERLKNRYSNSNDALKDIRNRLTTALYELKELLNSDYYHIVVNKDIQDASKTVLKIIDGQQYPSNEGRSVAKSLINDINNYLG